MPSYSTMRFADVASPVAGTLPGAGTQSVVDSTPSFTFSGAGTNRSMAETPTPASADIPDTRDSGAGAVNWFVRKFVSEPLSAQAIAAQNWTVKAGAFESSGNANWLVWGFVLYLWRPSTGALITMIVDSPNGGAIESGTTSSNVAKTLAGAAATAQSGDVLVVELWANQTAVSMTGAYTRDILYGSNTAGAINEGALVATNALTFNGGGTAWDPGVQADALGITDSVGISVGRGVAVNDALGIVDAPTFVSVYDRAVADALGITDTPTPAEGFNLSVADPLAIVDSALPVKIIPVQVDDALVITDAQSFDRVLAVSDALGITDANTSAVGVNRTVADPLAITDSASPIILKVVQIDDALGIQDLAVFAYGKGLADALGVTDQAIPAVGFNKSVADALGITDSAALQVARFLALNDSLGITDGQVIGLARILTIADALGITDVVVPVGSGGVAFIDFDGELTLELLDVVHVLELSERVQTIVLDERDRDLELDEGVERGLDLDA